MPTNIVPVTVIGQLKRAHIAFIWFVYYEDYVFRCSFLLGIFSKFPLQVMKLVLQTPAYNTPVKVMKRQQPFNFLLSNLFSASSTFLEEVAWQWRASVCFTWLKDVLFSFPFKQNGKSAYIWILTGLRTLVTSEIWSREGRIELWFWWGTRLGAGRGTATHFIFWRGRPDATCTWTGRLGATGKVWEAFEGPGRTWIFVGNLFSSASE